MSFDRFNLHATLAGNLRTLGFVKPTPIQDGAIPDVMAGHDVVGLAQTGTGKTAAFVLPILQRLLSGPRHRSRALIIGPTRELTDQTTEVFHELGKGTNLHVAKVYGGVGMSPQIEALRRGAEIVAACPGRLLDHIRSGHANLAHIEVVVLDEADQMFDMGFLPDIRRILRALPATRQTLMFSATMPEEIRKLAHEFLRNPKTVQVARIAPVETVAHAIFPVAQARKTDLLIELLHKTDTESVIVFTRTKHRAKRLAQQLQQAGLKATSLQGNLSQQQRQRAMQGFRDGAYQILVATDIASRGIDVSDISHVINFDMPSTVDAYTHRIGRTGRAAKTGDAYTLVTSEDTDMIRRIERILNAPLERKKLDGFDAGDPSAVAPREPRGPRGGGQHHGGQGPRRQGQQQGHGGHGQRRHGPGGHGKPGQRQGQGHAHKPHAGHAQQGSAQAGGHSAGPAQSPSPQPAAHQAPSKRSFWKRSFGGLSGRH